MSPKKLSKFLTPSDSCLGLTDSHGLSVGKREKLEGLTRRTRLRILVGHGRCPGHGRRRPGGPRSYHSVCFFVLCNRHWFNKAPGPDPTELGVTYLPSTISSDAGYVAPVNIGALVKLGSRSLAKQDRDWSSRPPGTGLHVPFWRHR